MTLDEAIKHCEEKADELNKEVLNQANLCNAREMADCQECARDHEQLAEWLKELKAYKESPKSDLISREALREDFKSRLALCNEWIAKAKDKETKIRASAVKAYLAEVIMTIDNAPTVEPKQGKWVGKEEYDDYPNKMVCECSECGKMICVSHNDFPKFCENCGADMRGAE